VPVGTFDADEGAAVAGVVVEPAEVLEPEKLDVEMQAIADVFHGTGDPHRPWGDSQIGHSALLRITPIWADSLLTVPVLTGPSGQLPGIVGFS
jgi:hypothetical protein